MVELNDPEDSSNQNDSKSQIPPNLHSGDRHLQDLNIIVCQQGPLLKAFTQLSSQVEYISQ